MIQEQSIRIFDLIMSFSEAIDLIDQSVSNHHMQVAYIAYSIAQELQLSREEQNEMIFAGALHDIGALSLHERIDTLEFEYSSSDSHAELGYKLLNHSSLFTNIANIIRFHHVYWNYGLGTSYKDLEVSLGSHILHIADRIAVAIRKDQFILSQRKEIITKINGNKHTQFHPDLVDAFVNIAKKEAFWLDLSSRSISSILLEKCGIGVIELNTNRLLEITKLFSKIIDFRSKYTATHSSGVAAISEKLCLLYGFSEHECQLMRVAGYLHDIGKLAIPIEILDKPGKLTKEEYEIIKSHTYYTFRILERAGLHQIKTWAAYHHEQLDGQGYPFRIKGEELTLKSRILAVADVYTALTEDRPYRKGMSNEQAINILLNMVQKRKLDQNVVNILIENLEVIQNTRKQAQYSTLEEYDDFVK